MVRDQAPNATVVLVSTHCASTTMDPLIFNMLRNRFKEIINTHFPIDSKTGTGIEVFKSFLLTEALKSSDHVVPLHISRGCDCISSFIKLNPSILSVTEKKLFEIMNYNDLDEHDPRVVIKILNSLDAVRLLSNGEFLLQQQKLADVLACVITKNAGTLHSLSTLLKDGFFHHSEDVLGAIWGKYPSQLWSCSPINGVVGVSPFLQLFFDSGLAYQVFDSLGNPQPRSIIPCMLPVGPRDFQGDINDENDLLKHVLSNSDLSSTILEKLNISFNVLPITFFAQLMAAARTLAVNGGVWLNGAIFSVDVSHALVMEGQNSIAISLLGENRAVRTVLLLKVAELMRTKFSSMNISEIWLSKGMRKWSGDDMRETLLYGNGILTSTKNGITVNAVDVKSLWVLFPEGYDFSITYDPLELLKKTVERARRVGREHSKEFLPLINFYLRQCVPTFRNLVGLPVNSEQPQALWIKVRSTGRFRLLPFSPSLLPYEPWRTLTEAEIDLGPVCISDNCSSKESIALRDWFSLISPLSYPPLNGELADFELLDSKNVKTVIAKEDDFFIQIGDSLLSKKVAQQARATKSTSDIEVPKIS